MSIIGYGWGAISFFEKLATEIVHTFLEINIDMHTDFAGQYLSINSMLLMVSTFAFAMCMTKDLSQFAIIGKIALFCLTYIVVVLFVQSFFLFDINDAGQIKLFAELNIIKLSTCFTSVLFAFNSVINIFSCIIKIENPSERRITKMVSISSLSVYGF